MRGKSSRFSSFGGRWVMIVHVEQNLVAREKERMGGTTGKQEVIG
jgi:hypothetical protein